MDMRVFSVLLDAAFDLETLHFQKTDPITQVFSEYRTTIQSCYLLTGIGDLEITVTEKETKTNEIYMEAYFINRMSMIGDQTVENMIIDQLETEVFLGYDEFDTKKCTCLNIGK